MNDEHPRTVDLEVTVPGTPAQVWDAIATGPGISSWLQPTHVDEHVGGRFAYDMGGGPVDGGTVTDYDPPTRFATETPWSAGRQEATLATEWVVAARDESSCVVRMVMSGFGPGDDWDGELDALREGMPVALETLRLYLTHFAGRRPATVSESAALSRNQPSAFPALLSATGLTEARPGAHVTLTAPAPDLAGTVAVRRTGRHRSDVVLLLDGPAPGIADLATYADPSGDGGSHVAVHVLLFDDAATSIADRERTRWATWPTDTARNLRKDTP